MKYNTHSKYQDHEFMRISRCMLVERLVSIQGGF